MVTLSMICLIIKLFLHFTKTTLICLKVNKFIEVETRNERSMNNFVNGLKNLDIYH